MRWSVVVNPRAGGGAAARRLDEVRRAAEEVLQAEVRLTEGPGHATELARGLVDQGFDAIVAVGGDGTANEVVNGLFDGARPRREGVVFGLVHAGTGGDLVKTLQVPDDPSEALRGFATRPPRPIDVLHLRFTSHDGTPVERIGVNVTGFGLNGEVVHRANRSSKRLGSATFAAAAAAAVRTYHPPEVRLTARTALDQPWDWVGPLTAAFVGNGAYCGGGMWIGRGGAIDDGLADLTVIPQLPLSRMILGAPRLFTGSIERVKGVSRVGIRHLSAFANSETKVLIDVDGEQPGFLPIEISVVHKSLLVAS